MDSTAEPIRQDIDNIRASMTEKMEQIEEKIKGTVSETTDSVKRMVDIKHQAAEYPWAAVGLSVLAGYVLGSLGSDEPDQPRHSSAGHQTYVTSAAESYERARNPAGTEHGPSYTGHSSAGSWNSGANGGANSAANSGAWQSEGHRGEKPGLLDSVTSQFGDEIETLKSAAIASLVGLLRDTVRQNFPGMHQEIERTRHEKGFSSSTGGQYAGDASNAASGVAPSGSNYAHTTTNPAHVAGTYTAGSGRSSGRS